MTDIEDKDMEMILTAVSKQADYLERLIEQRIDCSVKTSDLFVDMVRLEGKIRQIIYDRQPKLNKPRL